MRWQSTQGRSRPVLVLSPDVASAIGRHTGVPFFTNENVGCDSGTNFPIATAEKSVEQGLMSASESAQPRVCCLIQLERKASLNLNVIPHLRQQRVIGKLEDGAMECKMSIEHRLLIILAPGALHGILTLREYRCGRG
jgi:mRNA-degrading endonuclease toxin of MazEF toxin-antitoxin module